MAEKRGERIPIKFIDRYGLKGPYLNYEYSYHLNQRYKEQVIRPLGVFLAKSYDHAKVLDVASGTGEVATYFSGLKNLQVVQADLSQFALGKSKGQRVRSLAQQMPFEDSSFDVIHMKDALVHFEDQTELLAEFQRVLKPSSLLVLTSFEYSKKVFGIILKSQPFISMLLPYFNKNQFITWASFFERRKIFDISPPFFPVSEKAVIKLAKKNGFAEIDKTHWHTDWRNPDWTLFPEKRFSIIFKKTAE